MSPNEPSPTEPSPSGLPGSGSDRHTTPRRGTLLVARPRMLDPNFMHTVILVCEHAAEGTFGLILNRPMPLEVGDLDASVPLLHGRKDPVWAGGPVSPGELHVVHGLDGEIPGAMTIADGVRFGGDPVILHAALTAEPTVPVRFILGYAGWSAGQLDAEMADDAWVVVPATPKRVFDDRPETLWRRVLRAEGGSVAELADVPPDPSWN